MIRPKKKKKRKKLIKKVNEPKLEQNVNASAFSKEFGKKNN